MRSLPRFSLPNNRQNSLAHQKAERVKEPEVLRFVLRGLKAAPNEEAARLLLDTLAA